MVLVQYQYHIGREGASLSSTGLLIKYCRDMVATIKVLGQANVDAQPARMAIIWKVMVKVMVMMCEALTLNNSCCWAPPQDSTAFCATRLSKGPQWSGGSGFF